MRKLRIQRKGRSLEERVSSNFNKETNFMTTGQSPMTMGEFTNVPRGNELAVVSSIDKDKRIKRRSHSLKVSNI